MNQCNILVKNLPDMAKYPQQHLEIPQVPMALPIGDNLGYLPDASRGHQWASTVICIHTSYVFTVPMEEKSAENVVHIRHICSQRVIME